MRNNIFLGLIITLFCANFIFGQVNQYPTSGDVTISNYSPQLILQRNTNEGGFISGIQTKMLNGTDGWYFGALQTDSWIVSKGNYTNPKLTVLSNGNVGIGTLNPSNLQGWSNVLDVYGAHHSKILATSEDSSYRVGIFSHNQEWYGGGGFVGTESNHTLHLITNYNVKMSILTNGFVGIGTTNPTSLLTVAGNINSREVKVTVDAGADFVFENNYNLPSLDSVDKFIKENKHLPEIASAEAMKKEGINLSEMNIKLLQKIEELTLYSIEQNNKISKLEEQNKKLSDLEKRLEKIESNSK